MKRGRILASTLRSRPPEEKALIARRLERSVVPLFGDGVLTVPVAATYPLERVAEAYDRFSAGAKLGKIILTL
jgi:NADPH2:quinone reductase